MLLFIGSIGFFIGENKMKVTKSYLKQIIKEELGRMEEADEPYINPDGKDISQYLSPADKAMTSFVNLRREIGPIALDPNTEIGQKYREQLKTINTKDVQTIEAAIKVIEDLKVKLGL